MSNEQPNETTTGNRKTYDHLPLGHPAIQIEPGTGIVEFADGTRVFATDVEVEIDGRQNEARMRARRKAKQGWAVDSTAKTITLGFPTLPPDHFNLTIGGTEFRMTPIFDECGNLLRWEGVNIADPRDTMVVDAGTITPL